MVIHTKKKATLHTHRKREVSIKGSGVYTVRKGPKVVGSTISDSRLYRSASERIKVKARRQYRKSTVHDTDVRDMRVGGFKRRIHESNMSIKTKKTNLHIAGVAAAKATTDQLEGGPEIQQAAGIAYELSRPAMGVSSNGKLFVAMPSYKTKQTDENGKAIYQDLCYPVTREFREQLFGDILEAYEKECEKNCEEFSDRMKEQEKEKMEDAPVQEAAIR